jgi:Ohr subfamily peroxiredoxin
MLTALQTHRGQCLEDRYLPNITKRPQYLCQADNSPNSDMGMPRELGGDGTKTNPEELFAAGYGACFQSAMNACANSMGLKMPETAQDSVVETAVSLVGDMKSLDLGLKVDMTIKVRGMSKDELEKIVAKAKEVCPYSRATQGNVSTNVKIEML